MAGYPHSSVKKVVRIHFLWGEPNGSKSIVQDALLCSPEDVTEASSAIAIDKFGFRHALCFFQERLDLGIALDRINE
jgi:hypothetical protein